MASYFLWVEWFYCPRRDPFDADVQTELFALGCTIYFIMMGHAVFPDIVDGEDAWFERVEHRLATQQFPEDTHACSDITRKCWHKEYKSADELLLDLKTVREELLGGDGSRAAVQDVPSSTRSQ
ncbi:hypothetical protein AbraIFM66950_006723 [Aspergillus brasiliensis]|nr:hypothetical protein AbraIFM66950_006723 [Aspergillus brasiliensis]